MLEKTEAYRTKDGTVFPKQGVEEIIIYKTEDDRTFFNKGEAEVHLDELKNEKKLTNTINKIRQLFEQELTMYINSTNDYKGVSIEDKNLECDFWDDESQSLANASNVDVTIEDFKDYVLLVKALLKDFHLEKAIKIIKKVTHNKETS